MKILNLYAGIGGNRKLWGDEHDITAIEINPKIAECYKKLFPKDNVVISDAHEYLIKNFRDFDFIWASPPCVSHSSLNFYNWNIPDRLRYPDMSLYQEILLLQHFFKGKWVIENVKPYYTPLIKPTFMIDRHYFWSSDFLMLPQFNDFYTSIRDDIKAMAKAYGYDLDILKSSGVDCRQVLRNLVVPEIGKNIFDAICKVKGEENAG